VSQIFEEGCLQDVFGLEFPNLQSLKYQLVHQSLDYNYEWMSEVLLGLRDLISRTPSLRRLDLLFYEGRHSFWKALAGLPNLRSLKVRYVPVDEPAASEFWNICSRLETLSARFRHDFTMSTVATTFPRIKRLEIFGDPESSLKDQSELIARCPHLEVLYWNPRFAAHIGYKIFSQAVTPPMLQTSMLKDFVERLASEALFMLEELSLFGLDLSDMDVASILAAMKRVTTLSPPCSNFGPLSIQALRSHFLTLKEVNLDCCDGMTSEITLEFLSSCPLLHELHRGNIELRDVRQDIVQVRPWICRQMKVLFLRIDLYPDGRVGTDATAIIIRFLSNCLVWAS
ncbi:hypothetical protein BGX26_002064, partial [Mortierella sp. AD094]